MILLILIPISLLIWNVSLILKGGKGSAIALAVVNAIPAGLLLLLELSYDGGAWYWCVSWISIALLVIGLLSGWATSCAALRPPVSAQFSPLICRASFPQT